MVVALVCDVAHGHNIDIGPKPHRRFGLNNAWDLSDTWAAIIPPLMVVSTNRLMPDFGNAFETGGPDSSC